MAEIKQIQVGSTAYDIAAKYILSNDATPTLKSWGDIVSLVNTAKLQFLICNAANNTPKGVTFTPKGSSTSITGTLEADAGSTTTFYLVYHSHDDKDSYDEYVTTGSVWEKIGNTDVDLSGYQQTGKTLTSSGPSTNTTSEASGYTAEVSGIVKYDKSNANTDNAGGFTIDGVNFSFGGTTATITLSTDYTPAGSITGSQSVSAHSHTVNVATANAVTGVKSDGSVNVVTGYSNFSGGEASGTFVTSAIKNVKLNSATATSTGAVEYLEGISGSAPSLGGITSFNTDAIKTASLTGTTTFGTAFTVSNGILSLSTATVGITTTTASKATVTISGGSYTATTKYMKATGTNASKATVTISGGSYSGTTKYLTGSGDAAATGSVSWTAASLGAPSTATVIKSTGLASSSFMTGATLGTAGGVTISGSNFSFSGTSATIEVEGSYTPVGSITGKQTVSAHSHTIGTTETNATVSLGAAITAHTHTMGNHTHSVTTSNS